MLGGAQFVEALDRLGYPGASSLKASEFDWLFECAPENLHFLRFVCRSLNQSNVIRVEEAQAFKELKESGKPLLDEAALAELLKSDGSGGNILRPSASSSVFASQEDIALEDLEADLQRLLKERDLKQQRYKRLQNLATSRSDVDLRLGSELESAVHNLQAAKTSIGAENANTNCLLQKLTDEVKSLASYMPVEMDQNRKGQREHPAALLSQLTLGPYLHQEELNTKTLTAFTQTHFFQGISDIVETSCSERFQVHDLSYCDIEEESNGSKDRKREECVVERRRTEMGRLQWAHVVAQHQLMQATAEEKSLQAGLDWLAGKGSHTKVWKANTATCNAHTQDARVFIPIFSLCQNISMSSSLHVHEVVSKKELQTTEDELEALLHGPVPVALKKSARLLNVPVVRGDLDLQVARQDYYTKRQNQVSCHSRTCLGLNTRKEHTSGELIIFSSFLPGPRLSPSPEGLL